MKVSLVRRGRKLRKTKGRTSMSRPLGPAFFSRGHIMTSQDVARDTHLLSNLPPSLLLVPTLRDAFPHLCVTSMMFGAQESVHWGRKVMTNVSNFFARMGFGPNWRQHQPPRTRTNRRNVRRTATGIITKYGYSLWSTQALHTRIWGSKSLMPALPFLAVSNAVGTQTSPPRPEEVSMQSLR